MKRVVALLLTFVMAMTVLASGISDEQTRTEEYEKELRTLLLLYRVQGDNIGDENVIYTYLAFMQYINSSTIDYFYTAYSKMIDGSGGMMEKMKGLVNSVASIANTVSGAYREWYNGNLTKKQFMDIMIPIANGILESNK